MPERKSKKPTPRGKKRLASPKSDNGSSQPGPSPGQPSASPPGETASRAVDTNSPIASEQGPKKPTQEERIAKNLIKTIIALPLLDKLNKESLDRAADPSRPAATYPVIIDLNLDYPKGRDKARDWVFAEIERLISSRGENRRAQSVDRKKSGFNEQYVFARLEGNVIRELVQQDGKEKEEVRVEQGKPRRARAVYQIWEDFPLTPLISSTICTVKADAAQISFSALGKDIVWAVIDSGIQGDHPHFQTNKNLTGQVEEWHYDFTGGDNPPKTALVDGFGHGTHVAGILAGGIPPKPNARPVDPHPDILAYSRMLKPDEGQTDRDVTYEPIELPSICGMAPHCKLVSLKVLDASGQGGASNIIAALGHIQQINSYGRRIRVHGVNLSVGYPFDPEWFACGQSQLCVEVDRLVRSGVVVVVAAGNSGYGVLATAFTGARSAGMGLTINDPGNADLAITVGSTHRNMPHIYGVSYFSSKGPTGDGRPKPDLVAPGEKILSCAAGEMREKVKVKLDKDVTYVEDSGTSMAAPHVSGVIAAFLSVRREFIGQPERVKQIFMSTATDLRRERFFQGAGLVDIMRAIQSV
ncbi:MAG: S8 family peptidase [Nitrospiraceae bacterium]